MMLKDNLRILHVVPSYLPAVRYGGPIYSVHGLCRGLAALGQEVHVFTTNVDGPGDSDVPLDAPVDLDGVRIRYFSSTHGRRLYFSPPMQRALRAGIGGYDLVHLHSVYLWPTWMAARCAHRHQVPYVISPRGMLVKDLIRRRNRWIKSLWIKIIEAKSLAQSAAVHVTSAVEAAELMRLNLALPPLFCVPNGIDPPATDAGVRDVLDGLPRPYVLFLGRVHWKKGLDRLIRAWKDVREAHLIIAGNDEENYRPELEALAQTQGIGARVRFIGAAGNGVKWALYQGAELFVLPSCSENFGNAVLEAMAMGCPVVVTPEVGLAPVVEQAAAGTVSGGTPGELAQAVKRLLADAAQRKDMGRRGARLAREEYSWEGIAQQMLHEYRRIVGVTGS